MAPPTAPRYTATNMSFPSDLADDQKQFFMTFAFYEYDRMNLSGILKLSNGTMLALPMPDKINDHPTADWQSDNLVDLAGMASTAGTAAMAGIANDKLKGALGVAAAGISAGGATASYLTGQTLNPFLVMLFKTPGFKSFTFSWTLAPRTRDETDTLQDIVQTFRKNMLPSSGFKIPGTGVNATLKFPMIVQPKFEPDDKLFRFKPCAITSVNFDYNPSGNPAFFKNTGGPVSIRLTVNLTEIEYWLQDDYTLGGM